MQKIKNIFKFIRNRGILEFIKESYFRISDNFYEKYYNVETAGMIPVENLGINTHEALEYLPIPYNHTRKILNKIPIDKSKSTLLDYGCGKGRVIVCAAAKNFKKIIGVELADIINIAKKNIEKMNYTKTKNIQLKHCDAQDFSIPEDVNIIYFFNPFTGSVLNKVTENIYSSYKEAPRKIYIIFFNNIHFDKLAINQDWLIKTYQSKFHSNLPCGIYETIG